jgi:hypothetical protein
MTEPGDEIENSASRTGRAARSTSAQNGNAARRDFLEST